MIVVPPHTIVHAAFVVSETVANLRVEPEVERVFGLVLGVPVSSLISMPTKSSVVRAFTPDRSGCTPSKGWTSIITMALLGAPA